MLGMLPLCAQEAEDRMVPGQILAAILALEIQHAEIQDTSIEVLSAQSGGLHGGTVRNDGLHALHDGANRPCLGMNSAKGACSVIFLRAPSGWRPKHAPNKTKEKATNNAKKIKALLALLAWY